MANEVDELRRYMRGCLGRTVLPKTKAPRLFEFGDIRADRLLPGGGIPDDAAVTLQVFTAKENWASRTYTYKQFRDLSVFFNPSSRYMNTDRTCAYYSHQIQRQYHKGLTADMAVKSLRMLNYIVPAVERWDAVGNDSPMYRKYGTWHAYFRNFLEPYPAFDVILNEVVGGRRLSGAFAKHFSLWNLKYVHWPVLFRGSIRAGVVHKNTILLLEQHRPVQMFLEKVTGYPVRILNKGELHEAA